MGLGQGGGGGEFLVLQHRPHLPPIYVCDQQLRRQKQQNTAELKSVILNELEKIVKEDYFFIL